MGGFGAGCAANIANRLSTAILEKELTQQEILIFNVVQNKICSPILNDQSDVIQSEYNPMAHGTFKDYKINKTDFMNSLIQNLVGDVAIQKKILGGETEYKAILEKYMDETFMPDEKKFHEQLVKHNIINLKDKNNRTFEDFYNVIANERDKSIDKCAKQLNDKINTHLRPKSTHVGFKYDAINNQISWTAPENSKVRYEKHLGYSFKNSEALLNKIFGKENVTINKTYLGRGCFGNKHKVTSVKINLSNIVKVPDNIPETRLEIMNLINSDKQNQQQK